MSDDRKLVQTVELPNDFHEHYAAINEAVGKGNFAFRPRIMAALSMAESVRMLDSRFKGCLTRLIPEAFYVNVENGDIKVVADRIMSSDHFCLSGDSEYLRIENTEDGKIGTDDLLRFAAYTSFRLICVGSPYDGKETLINYPLLTKKAYEEINSGRYGFIFSEKRNGFSEYIDREMLPKWNSVPGKVRKTFSNILDNGDKDSIGIEDWLKCMRMLRDCLVYVKGQFILCDPDASNKVSFLASEEYRVPIWPKKALYWYHVGKDIDNVGSEVVAGITPDGLENRSKIPWVVYRESNGMQSIGQGESIKPGESVKPAIGMDIEINGTHFKVVSGENQHGPGGVR